jgi:hypothetical protein
MFMLLFAFAACGSSHSEGVDGRFSADSKCDPPENAAAPFRGDIMETTVRLRDNTPFGRDLPLPALLDRGLARLTETYPRVHIRPPEPPQAMWKLAAELNRTAAIARCMLPPLDPDDGGPELALLRGVLEDLPLPGGAIYRPSAKSPDRIPDTPMAELSPSGEGQQGERADTAPRTQGDAAVYVRIDRIGPRGLSAALRSRLGSQAHGLILDLRGCAGGLLDESEALADVFLRDGRIAELRETNRTEEGRAANTPDDVDIPVIVLVNGATSGGAELFAAALKEHDRALIVGETTHGYGAITLWFRLKSGTMLSLPITDVVTPNGNVIQGRGIEPDAPTPARVGDKDPALTLSRAILVRAKGATRQALRETAALLDMR